MADKEALKKNLDKVAYVVAGVLAIAVLAVPFLLGGGLADLVAKTQGSLDKLEGRIASDDANLAEVPDWPKELAGIWAAPDAIESKPWGSMAAPVLIKRFDTTPPPDAVHAPGCLVLLECLRDASTRTVYLRVTGKLSPKNSLVTITGVSLERREDGGEWSPTPGFAATGDFEYEDRSVEAGKSYSYRFKSIAKALDVDPASGKVPNPPRAREQISNELAGHPIPHEVSLVVSTPTVNSLGELEIGRGDAYYWSYGESKEVRFRTTAGKAWAKGTTFGEKLEDGRDRFAIGRIREEEIVVDDRTSTNQFTFPVGAKRDDRLAVVAWEPISASCEEAPAPGAVTPEDGTTAGASSTVTPPAGTPGGSTPETEEASPTRPSTSGRRGFGG